MSTFTVRNARPEDYPDVARLFPELSVPDRLFSAETFVTEMMPLALVAVRPDGSVVGYTVWRTIPGSVHLSQLVACPAMRRAGVGRALMAAAIERARAAGCSAITLNVLPTNAAAIALYESFGLEAAHQNRALRLEWSHVDALPASAAPHAATALLPEDETSIERALAIPAGTLAYRRGLPGRVLRRIGQTAAACFDPGFPGIHPVRAPDIGHVLSLLRAFRSHARPEHSFVNLTLEDAPSLAGALEDAGATPTLETTLMRGVIGANPASSGGR